MKKIILFSSQIVNPGGAERLLFEEAKYFRERGVDVRILSFQVDEKALFNYRDSVELELINEKRVISRILALRKRLKKINPDIVIAQSWWDCEMLYPAIMFTRIPYVTHIHGTLFWFDELLQKEWRKYSVLHRKVFPEIRESLYGHREFINPSPEISLSRRVKLELMALLNYFAVRGAREIFVLTNRMGWEVQKLYNKKFTLATGCVDAKLLNYKPRFDVKEKLGLHGKKLILNVNRLDNRKRIDLLIRAFKKISDDYADVFLVIGGTGPARGMLENLAKSLKIEDRVKFAGYIRDEDLWDYYAGCDVFVHPNWADFAISPYEALALQKKVVWTTEMEMFEPLAKSGYVFAAEPNVEDLAKAIETALAADAKTRADMSDFTWDRYFGKIYKICEGIVEGKNIGSKEKYCD